MEITRAKIPLSGRFFCVAHGNDWLVRNIYGCVIVYEADSNGGYTGDAYSAVFVWIYVCFAKNRTLGAKKCGHPNKRSKVSGIYRCYCPYNGTLVRNYLPLWIAWQIGADGKRYHCPLYVDRFMEYGCFDQMVADTQRAFQLYREMVFGGRSCIYIFVGNIFRESTLSTFGSDFGSRPIDTPYVVWLFGAAQ